MSSTALTYTWPAAKGGRNWGEDSLGSALLITPPSGVRNEMFDEFMTSLTITAVGFTFRIA